MNTINMTQDDVKRVLEWVDECNENNIIRGEIHPIFDKGMLKTIVADELTHIYWQAVGCNKYDIKVTLPKSGTNQGALIGTASVLDTEDKFLILAQNINTKQRVVKRLRASYNNKMGPVHASRILIGTCVALVSSTLRYIDYHSRNKKIAYRTSSPKSNVGTSSAGDPVYNSNTELTISIDETIKYLSSVKRNTPINRKTDSWGVAGHWRHYRDDKGNITKSTFVKAYTKGNGKKKDKDYKLGGVL